MNRILSALFLILIPGILSAAGEIKVYANGNIRPILMEIGHYFQTRHPEWKVVLETGKVTDLKDKIGAGAVGDVVIGDAKLFEAIDALKVIEEASKKVLFTNPVIAVADENTEIELSDPKQINSDNFKKVALVSAKSPLGKSVRAYLEPLGLKDAAAEKKIEVADPKAALEAVKTGEAKWTLVYSSDASKRKVKRLFQVADASIPSIPFSVAILKRTKQEQQAANFIQALQSTISKKFFENAGFVWKANPLPQAQTQTKPKAQKNKKKEKKD